MFGTNFRKFPADVKSLLEKECNFTFFIGENSKNIKVKELIYSILEDSEAIEPLNYVNFHVYENGKHLKEKHNNSYVHKPEIIPAHPEFREPRRYEIPDKWLDPKDNTEISLQILKRNT